MWAYYYDEDEDETIYYHDGEEVVTLPGKESVIRNGLPYGEHYDGVLDAFQSAGTPDRLRMTYDLHIGFQKLDEPY